jgi:hypothetical protein
LESWLIGILIVTGSGCLLTSIFWFEDDAGKVLAVHPHATGEMKNLQDPQLVDAFARAADHLQASHGAKPVLRIPALPPPPTGAPAPTPVSPEVAESLNELPADLRAAFAQAAGQPAQQAQMLSTAARELPPEAFEERAAVFRALGGLGPEGHVALAESARALVQARPAEGRERQISATAEEAFRAAVPLALDSLGPEERARLEQELRALHPDGALRAILDEVMPAPVEE